MTKFHIVGIGGMGMSAVARLLLARGDRVSGSDKGSWPLAQALAADGATVATAFAAENVTGADVVVRSSAYGDTNPEIAAARAAGIPVWKREDAWRELARGKRVLAVAGTHGKSTTTALAWTALRAGGLEPSLICGAVLRDLGTNAYAGRGDFLVIEADEYDHAFLSLEPEIAIVLNVEHDHVDVFPTHADVKRAFRHFAAGVIRGGWLVACVDDPGAADLATNGGMRARTTGRVIVLFQPHTPSRLRAFFDDFAAALRTADASVVAETFSSVREAADSRAGAKALAVRAGAEYVVDTEAAARALANRARPGDLVLVLGAGDIRPAGVRLLELLRERGTAA